MSIPTLQDAAARLKAVLTTSRRNALPDSEFAGPNRSYPMHDERHARNALARASAQHNAGNLSDSQYNGIVAKVHKRWPDIGKDDSGKAAVLEFPSIGFKGNGLLAPRPSANGCFVKEAYRTEFKVDDAKGQVEAYANTFGYRDLDGDVTIKGAFLKTIVEDYRNIKALRNHSDLVGVPVHMDEDSTGLLTVTRFSSATRGQDALKEIRDGVLDKLSIGYRVPAGGSEIADWQGKQSRLLKTVRLKEYSFVDFAVNDRSTVVGVKSLDEISNVLYQLPRAVQWLTSPEAYAQLAEETLLEAICLFEEAADQLRIVCGLDPENDAGDQPGGTPDDGSTDESAAMNDDGSDVPPEDVAALAALAAATQGLLGAFRASQAPSNL